MTKSEFQKFSLLNPIARKHIEAFLADAKVAGYGRLTIVFTHRSIDEQNKLYGKGRTADQLKRLGINPKYAKPKEKIVTKLYGGKSMHNWGLAVDVQIQNYPQGHWDRIGNIGKRHGLIWGGDWKMRDYMHFEYRGDKSYWQIYQGQLPTK